MMNNEERRKATEWFRNRAKNCPMSGSRRMYEIATEALEERERNEQPHWIPCSERLPDYDEDVLVYANGLLRVWDRIKTLGDIDYWEDEYGYWVDFNDVDYWMPLPPSPEPPKESES